MSQCVLGPNRRLLIEHFHAVVYQNMPVELDEDVGKRLDETRGFIDYLLDNKIKVYGLTTGFGALRDTPVSSAASAQLSKNIILSHDAAIGRPLQEDIVLGAMLLRANSLSKGYSGFKRASMETLLAMIHKRIIPTVACSGSLGASGDLALLARLGRAMQGHDVEVTYQGQSIGAGEALRMAGIKPFTPSAKEGLALTNGTSFSAASLAIAYLKQLHCLENILAGTGLYLNATKSIDAAFSHSLNSVRGQQGQLLAANILRMFLKDSPFIDRAGIQDDYSQRCLPQIYGPKIEAFVRQFEVVISELDAVTDNPLLFKNEEISSDLADERFISYQNDRWCVISGGNFHGESLTTVADILALVNAKIALTVERQTTYLNNPSRNHQLFPVFLVGDQRNAGLHSGFMVPQYTANALTQKICHLANPISNFNLTSSNEVEDVVSYSASAAERLQDQLELMQQLCVVYFTMVMQAYALRRLEYPTVDSNLLCEQIYCLVQDALPQHKQYPLSEEMGFTDHYRLISQILQTTEIRKIIGAPLSSELGLLPMAMMRHPVPLISALDRVLDSSTDRLSSESHLFS